MTLNVAYLKKNQNSFTQRHSHKMSFIKIFRGEVLSQPGRVGGKSTEGSVRAIGNEGSGTGRRENSTV